ncbi:MAG: hypothetical protein JNM18_14200 [Planctomycetaceae bacterium]|nr:hypothetical protein [Planctomycetaceae bacterium]
MSLEKLSKQLQRELKRNPKQAGILALLGVVAVWFWLPLIWKSDDSMSSPVVTPAATETAASTAVTTVATTSTSATNPSTTTTTTNQPARWDQIVQEIDNDPLMQPITVLTAATLDRSPFAIYAHVEPVKVEETPEEVTPFIPPQPVEVVVTPDEAGLQVTGTIVSRTRSSATINGEAFRTGETIEGNDGVIFTLVSVEATGVVLERNGKQFPLTIRRKPRAGRVELRANE